MENKEMGNKEFTFMAKSHVNPQGRWGAVVLCGPVLGCMLVCLSGILSEAAAQTVPAPPVTPPHSNSTPKPTPTEWSAGDGEKLEAAGRAAMETLERKFKLTSLVKDIVADIQPLPTEEQFDRIRNLPSGLRIFVFWKLPEENITRIMWYGIKRKKENYPAHATELERIGNKLIGLVPLMVASNQDGLPRTSQLAPVLFNSLTPQEMMLIEKLEMGDDLKLSGSYLPLAECLRFSPKGEQFLRQLSAFSPTARELLADLQNGKHKSTAAADKLIYDDGFLCACEENEEETKQQ